MADAAGVPNGTEKPSVLIIGGLGKHFLFFLPFLPRRTPAHPLLWHSTNEASQGYIGRFLAKYIHTHSLASTVRIIDKVLPQLAHLAPEFTDPCHPSLFLQADASREASMSRIFDPPAGSTGSWDYVFNLGGETAHSQTAEVYKIRTLALSLTLGSEAAKRGVKAFVEASTGMVYSPSRTPRKESDKLKPWLKLAKCKLEAEEALSKIPGLNVVILRLAHVYGEYDSGFIAKALCLARVYQERERELKWLWTEDLRINTVHVEDVARALWSAAEWRAAKEENNNTTTTTTTATTTTTTTHNHNNSTEPPDAVAPASPTSPRRGGVAALTSPSSPSGASGDTGPNPHTTPIFNIVDHGHTSQGTLATIISQVFGIKTGFQGSLISRFAKLHLESVVDDLNEDILQPWADMLVQRGITRPGPLSPFLEKELLKDTDLSLDGASFERVTGFRYERGAGLSREGVDEMVRSYQRMGWWP